MPNCNSDSHLNGQFSAYNGKRLNRFSELPIYVHLNVYKNENVRKLHDIKFVMMSYTYRCKIIYGYI